MSAHPPLTSSPAAASGQFFRLTVSSADEAARVIREKLGENARVLSVRSVEAGGLFGFLSSPKLEVVAQVVAGPEAERSKATVSVSGPVVSAESGGAQVALKASRATIRLPQQSLTTLLRRSGFSEKLLLRLFESPAWIALNEMPLHRALVETGRHLRELAESRHDPAPLTRAAFLGTPGVGRTTALCKWLANEVFRRARIGHVVTAEFDRPNPTGPLPVFCEALGVPMAHFPASTQPAAPGGFVYFDLPGISSRHPAENAPIAEFLEREGIEQRVLVLNAAYDHAALRAGYAAGRSLGATHVVFTHLDEVMQWGRLWDYLIDGDLQPLFLATGPSLTGDCELDGLEAVARRTLPVAPEPEEAGAEDESAMETDSTLNTAA
jgi:flagellar biosynthesis protein FlhF